jgi:hypothetical protein
MFWTPIGQKRGRAVEKKESETPKKSGNHWFLAENHSAVMLLSGT